MLYEDEPKESVIRLWLHGIVASNNAQQELSLIFQLIQACCAHVLEHESEQPLTAEEAATKLKVDPDLVGRVGFLLEHVDYELGISVYRKGSSWECKPKRDVLQFRKAKDFKEVWKLREKAQRAKKQAKTKTVLSLPQAIMATNLNTAGSAQRVFYSWQSDLSSRTNRNFIEDSLRRAIKKVNREGLIQLEAAPDRDTRGLPGSPNIVDAILGKIEESALFVCDVSIVNAGQQRPMPNPNVLFEACWFRKILH